MTVVAFDMIGTFFSLDAPRAHLSRVGAPRHALDLWIAQSLRDYFAASVAERYIGLKEVLSAELPRTLKSLDVDVGPEVLSTIMGSMSELDPAPGAGVACRLLRDAGHRIVAVTNGGKDQTEGLLERAGLRPRFSSVLSADEVRRSKPHRSVYAQVPRPDEGKAWLIAAHAWDVLGAQQAGLGAIWVAGTEAEPLAAYPSPDLIAKDLEEAAALVPPG